MVQDDSSVLTLNPTFARNHQPKLHHLGQLPTHHSPVTIHHFSPTSRALPFLPLAVLKKSNSHWRLQQHHWNKWFFASLPQQSTYSKHPGLTGSFPCSSCATGVCSSGHPTVLPQEQSCLQFRCSMGQDSKKGAISKMYV